MQKVAQKNAFCYIIHVNKKLQLHIAHVPDLRSCGVSKMQLQP